VAVIGVAQEFQRVWTAYEARPPPARRGGRSSRPTSGVACYFYLWNEVLDPAFIKV